MAKYKRIVNLSEMRKKITKIQKDLKNIKGYEAKTRYLAEILDDQSEGYYFDDDFEEYSTYYTSYYRYYILNINSFKKQLDSLVKTYGDGDYKIGIQFSRSNTIDETYNSKTVLFIFIPWRTNLTTLTPVIELYVKAGFAILQAITGDNFIPEYILCKDGYYPNRNSFIQMGIPVTEVNPPKIQVPLLYEDVK